MNYYSLIIKNGMKIINDLIKIALELKNKNVIEKIAER